VRSSLFSSEQPLQSSVALRVAPRATRLAFASLHFDDSLRAKARDPAFDEALHDHRVREPLHFGIGDLERSEQRNAGLLHFLR
jgi:hypothetical protein